MINYTLVIVIFNCIFYDIDKSKLFFIKNNILNEHHINQIKLVLSIVTSVYIMQYRLTFTVY